MSVRNAVLAGVIVALSAAGAAAQAERPAVGPERPFQLAPRVEKVLPNGLRVIVTRQAVVPKVSVTLTVLSGLSSDPPNLPGLAAMTGEAIQEGTKTRSSREIRRQAFGMGGTIASAASQDFTSITARGLTEFAPGLMDLIADVVMNPSFPADEVGILQQQHLQSLEQAQASPQFVSNREFRARLFGTHPYARVSETVESIQGANREKLAAFHHDHYRPRNAFLLVVGAVDADAVFAAATKSFGGWTVTGDPGAAATPPAPAPAPLTGRHIYFVQRPNSVQSSISIGNFAIKRSDPRWYEMALANSILGGAFNSRIVRNIREEKGYTYSPSSLFQAFGQAGFYKFGADVRNDVTGPTLTEVFKEIDKMRAAGSEGDELNGAKQYMRGVFAFQSASQAGLAGLLNNVYVYGLPKDYPETFRSKIAAITPAQVKEGADALFGSSDSVVVIVGDWAKVKTQLAGFGTITFLDLSGKKIAEPGA
ncbi:MAG TPA: pitrilysin family protein [Vicinamibacterales bacterium]|jgi:zinc protease|nr:pitrilysin family protein [Vicinamibacterales bacterium]